MEVGVGAELWFRMGSGLRFGKIPTFFSIVSNGVSQILALLRKNRAFLKMKLYRDLRFLSLSWHLVVQSQQWKHQNSA